MPRGNVLNKLPGALLVTLILSATASSAPSSEPFFQKLLGEWQSAGTSFGRPTKSTAVWSSVLNDRFYKIEYQIDFVDIDDASSSFQGVAFYKIDESGGFWADNNGELHPISTAVTNDSLLANWGRDGGKQGRTKYELISKSELRITDWIKTDSGWRQFNQNSYHRIK